MNRQEIFDRAATHLLKQMKKSTRNDTCLYRGPRKTSCAIGCLIPDELYSKEFEGRAVGAFLVKVINAANYDEETLEKAMGINKLLNVSKQENFLAQLQYIHDDHQPPIWKDKLIEFAKRYKLNTKAIQ